VKILALETSERLGTIAAADGDKLLVELELHPSQRAAQSLVPGLKALLEQAGWKPADVELVAVSSGPGSFTGLRIGITAAKTFAYVVGAEVVAVDTLEAIAAGTPLSLDTLSGDTPPIESLSVAVDAQRGDVVAQSFRRTDDGRFLPTGDARLIDADAWLADLAPGTFVSGPVLKKLIDRLPDQITAVPARFWPPRAATVAQLAQTAYAAGRRDDIWKLAPRYSRRSAAEEKREARKAEASRGPMKPGHGLNTD
jgi:tRNA threonylcarbamoyladenosine biosynthesis protein TsaB